MIDAIRRYLQGYPGLRDGVLHLDGLPENSGTYSLSVIPTEPVLRRYMDGGERRQMLFLLQSRRFFGENLPSQSENLQFFSDFDAWLRRKNAAGELPELGENRVCLEMSLVTSGYIMEASSQGCGRYQAELKIIYFEGA